jgi:hypothetical protein
MNGFAQALRRDGKYAVVFDERQRFVGHLLDKGQMSRGADELAGPGLVDESLLVQVEPGFQSQHCVRNQCGFRRSAQPDRGRQSRDEPPGRGLG